MKNKCLPRLCPSLPLLSYLIQKIFEMPFLSNAYQHVAVNPSDALTGRWKNSRINEFELVEPKDAWFIIVPRNVIAIVSLH